MSFKTGGPFGSRDFDAYIIRRTEKEVIDYIHRMEYILLVEPRQQGKTSLINYLQRRAHLPNIKFVYINLSGLVSVNSDEKKWYETLSGQLLAKLSDIDMSHLLNTPQTSIECQEFLFKLSHVFEQANKYLVIALDGISHTHVATEVNFFVTLRAIYNERGSRSAFDHLTFILCGVFRPSKIINNKTISPFNIAQRVQLPDFTFAEVMALVAKESWSNHSAADIAKFIYTWTQGQPYLTQVLGKMLLNQTRLDEALIDQLVREDQDHISYLTSHLPIGSENLSFVQDLLEARRRVRYAPTILIDSAQDSLDLLGIIKADSTGYCTIRNQVYHRAISWYIDQLRYMNKLSTIPRIPIRNILFLSAAPTNLQPLRAGKEFEEIRNQLQQVDSYQRIELESRWSIQWHAIAQSISSKRADLIHFSCHGTVDGELLFEEPTGRSEKITPRDLSSLFEQFTNQIACVFFNACHSALLARVVAWKIKYVIGIKGNITDEAAIAFAHGFYGALSIGSTIEDSFVKGRIAITDRMVEETIELHLYKETQLRKEVISPSTLGY